MARYGVSSWIARDLPAGEAIDVIAANGFRETEVSACTSALVKEWEQDPEGVMRRLAAAGLEVQQIHINEPGRALDALDEPTRQASLAENVRYFELLRRSGVPWCVIHPIGSRDKPANDSRAARKASSLESLKALADAAGRMGVGMAVENLPGRDNQRPCGTMGELREMIAGLGDHVRLCFDIGHTVMRGLDPVEEIRVAGDKLISLHLHDVNVNNKDHFIPGEGTIDWEAVLGALDALDFRGIRTLEIKPPPDNVPQRVAQVAAVRRQWEARPR